MMSISCIAALLLVGCGSASDTKKPVTKVIPVTAVDSGVTVVEAGTQDTGSTTPPVQDAGTPPSEDTGTPPVTKDAGKDVVTVEHDAGEDAHKVTEVDAGVDAGSCTLPTGTYTYVFTSMVDTCDNVLASYMVGPVPSGSVTIEQLVPAFCNAAGDTPVVSDNTETANGCSTSVTTTCSDPAVPPPDGGSDPLKNTSVVTMTSNAAGTVLTGTLSLTQTDEITPTVRCTQTYTFVATAK